MQYPHDEQRHYLPQDASLGWRLDGAPDEVIGIGLAQYCVIILSVITACQLIKSVPLRWCASEAVFIWWAALKGLLICLTDHKGKTWTIRASPGLQTVFFSQHTWHMHKQSQLFVLFLCTESETLMWALLLYACTCNLLYFWNKQAVEPQKTIIIAGSSTMETNQPTVPPGVHPTYIRNQISHCKDNSLTWLHHGS